MRTVVDPIRIFEVSKNGAAEVSTLLCAVAALGTGINQQVVAAVTGKKIRIMGVLAQSSNAANGTYTFQSGAAGSTLFGPIAAPLVTDPMSPLMLPITDSGYLETNSGDGLYSDIATDSVTLTVFYITYTP